TLAVTGYTVNDGNGGADYAVTTQTASGTITPYAFSYTVGNDTQTYGAPANLAADLPGTIGTGVNGETVSISYTSAGDTAAAHVGSYDIIGTLSDGTGKASDYSDTLTPGSLTVSPYSFTYQIGN